VTTYYMLECFVPKGETVLDIEGYPLIDGIDSWILGSPFQRSPPEPIRLNWDPDTEGLKRSLYDATIPLMHRDLLQAVESCGVDNLDTYAVEIQDHATGEVDSNYRAINLIGIVRAADRSKSKYRDLSGMGRIDMDFDGLSIVTECPRDFLMFRLAECVTGWVVHESLKRRLEELGGFGLTFVNPEEWIG
jgi:hypothetical protein